MKAYQAWAGDIRVTDKSPRGAAMRFFAAYPNKRKCNVTEGTSDGQVFTVKYNLHPRQGPAYWPDVTKKTLETLPEN